jgi:hypothetical protein
MRIPSQPPLVKAEFASLWKREVGRDFIKFSKPRISSGEDEVI